MRCGELMFRVRLLALATFWSMASPSTFADERESWRSLLASRLSVAKAVFPCAKQQCQLHVYRELGDEAPRPGLTLVWIVVPAKSASIKLQIPDRTADVRSIYKDSPADGHSAVTVTAGFFARQGDKRYPIGLHVTGSKIMHPMADFRGRDGNPMGGVVALKESGLVIEGLVKARKNVGQYVEAVQSKPILVESGSNGVAIESHSDPFHNRVAVGVDDSGAVHVFGAFASNMKALTLFEFSDILVRLAQRSRLSNLNVINLDGGPSAHLYVPSRDLHFGSVGVGYVPSVLLVGRLK